MTESISKGYSLKTDQGSPSQLAKTEVAANFVFENSCGYGEGNEIFHTGEIRKDYPKLDQRPNVFR